MRAPSKKDNLKMFETASKHYIRVQKQMGMRSPIPYGWMRKKDTGELIVYSHGVSAKNLMKLLEDNQFNL